MKLSCLLETCSILSFVLSKDGQAYDPDILSIASNSKDVRPGSLFIAVRGLKADGHDYMDEAVKNGASAVIAEYNPKNLNFVIQVPNSRLAMAAIASGFYGNPSEKLTLIGVTGTNGKTTTTWILESIFKSSGFNTGVIGTVNIRYNGKTINNPVTTPDSIDLQKTLFEMKKAGVTHVVMEVSSHGLDLNRVDFCRFDAGIFTNLTQDHLDYHKNLEDYFNCKKRFFNEFLGPNGKNNAPAVLNIDYEKGEFLFNTLLCQKFSVSTEKQADIYSKDIIDDIFGISGLLCLKNSSIPFRSALTGRFNLENILCAAGAAHALGVSPEAIKKGIEDCRSIPGRLEKISHPIDRFMFADYAHTPDALESILTTLKTRAPKRLITVFGCGGNRDRSKRPVMGKIACEHSDIAIVTSDNPRSEHPDAIIKDILDGIAHAERLFDEDPLVNPFKKGFLVEADRKKALAKAVYISKPGDIIVAAGKGHETYQITNSGTHHFDDREELWKAADEFCDLFKPIPWTVSDLSKALNTAPAFSTLENDHLFSGISTDSRTIKESELFLALKGDRFDGHAFVQALIEKGIKGFVLETPFYSKLNQDLKKETAQKNIVVFETSHSLTSLGDLARYQRLRSNVRLLAVTGSSGKTTTRKITEEIFKTRFHTHATIGNLNNEIGLPLTLLKLSAAHEWAVVEMGMNHPGEISRLSRIALPDIVMIINTAAVHLEGLGSIDNVAKAKAEIFDGMREHGTAILNADDLRRGILEEKARKNKSVETLLFFGSADDADISAKNIRTSETHTEFSVKTGEKEYSLIIHSPAPFMVENCLSAILAAVKAKIDSTTIQKGINAFHPVSGRMNIYKVCDTLTLIDDTYNANPASVAKALHTLHAVSGRGNGIAVLGDMLELGENSEELHRQIGRTVAELGIKKLFVFGDKVQGLIDGAIERGFPKTDIFHGTKEEIAEKIHGQADTKTWVLIKGSRGMSMETVIQNLKKLLKVKPDVL
ncbi:MAG: UDP-N-acetylmuramoyl-tripeptide--D-alanyl-D-alanine ligase [Desulfobacterales bacterium RIFOXYA12_FULL_46_15]|nr:MAG: UDP-N-acetylmuramoyl-tripeptide--D-alanyl-D-alanine ligase [Desulfobacterales bacterium RIFOXYA12_FULL_46_15]